MCDTATMTTSRFSRVPARPVPRRPGAAAPLPDALLELLPAPVFAAGPDGRNTHANAAFARAAGRPAAALLGEGWVEALHPDDRARVAEVWRQAVAAGEPYEVECRLRDAEGASRWFLARAAPERDAAGRAVRWVGVLADIDDRRAAEAASRAQAERFEALAAAQQAVERAGGELGAVLDVAAAGALAAVAAADGAVVELCEGEELVYVAAAGSSAPHRGLRLPLAGTLSGRALAAGAPLLCEDSETDPRVDRAACRRVGLRSMLVVPIARRGEAVGVLKLYAAAPRAFAEPALTAARLLVGAVSAGLGGVAEAEARHRAILDDLPVGVVLAEAPSGRILWGNRAVERIFRHPVLPSAGVEDYGAWRSYHADGAPVDGPREYPLARVLAGAESAEGEYHYARGDGTRAWVRIQGAPIRASDGRVTGAVVGITDVDELARARAALAEAVEAKEVLLGEVNHRVKNALQTVTGLLALQASKAHDPELRAALAEARGRLGVVARLHQRLYQSGAHAWVDLAGVLRELAEGTMRALGGAGRGGSRRAWRAC